MKVTGTFLKAGVVNANGRMYDEKALADAVAQFIKRDSPMYGTIGYPESPVVDLASASHKVNKISLKYDKIPRKLKKKLKKLGQLKNHCSLIGEIEFLDTQSGIAAALISKDMVIRPMGFGSINKDNVVEDYNIITFNLVDKETDAFKGIIE
jgi:hypothetical protein